MHEKASQRKANLSFWQIIFFSLVQMVCCWSIFAAVTRLVKFCAGCDMMLQFMNSSWCSIVVFALWTACAFLSYFIVSAAGNMFGDNSAYNGETDEVCDAEYESY